MSFVTPLFALGAIAAGIPLVLHLVKRERARRIEFPTLLYLRKISKKVIRFEKLRHLLLLFLRILAILLLALAFMRPYRETPAVAAAPGRTAEARIVLLDNSLSMSYGDRWTRASDAAAKILSGARPGDKVALLAFSDRTSEIAGFGSDPAAVRALLHQRVQPTDLPTRYAQALKTAERLALDAGTGKRTIYLISDFQKNGWSAEEQGFRLGAGIDLQAVDVGSQEYSNLALADVHVADGDENAGGALKIRASVINYGTQDRTGAKLALNVDGREVQSRRIDIPKGEVQGAEFEIPALTTGSHPVVLEVDDPQLTRDNRFVMALEASGRTPVWCVEAPGSGRGGRAPSFFLSRALNVSTLSPYRLNTVPPQKAESGLGGDGLLIWNDVPSAPAGIHDKIRDFVKRGGGLIVVVGDSSRAAEFNRTFGSWLPVKVEGSAASRRGGPADYALLTDIRLDHAVFRPFNEPNAGSFSTAKFYRHARLTAAQGAEVLARFDNGAPALVYAGVERGRVLVFASSADDSGNDLPLKAVFAPLWQQMLRYADNFRDATHAVQIGDTIAPRRLLLEAAMRQSKGDTDPGQSIAVLDPARQRVDLASGSDSVAVESAGFYEIRGPALSATVAVNPVPRESDLTHGNSEEMVSGWMSTEVRAAGLYEDEKPTPEEQDRRQRWWRLILAALVLVIVAEGVLANRAVLKTE